MQASHPERIPKAESDLGLALADWPRGPWIEVDQDPMHQDRMPLEWVPSDWARWEPTRLAQE